MGIPLGADQDYFYINCHGFRTAEKIFDHRIRFANVRIRTYSESNNDPNIISVPYNLRKRSRPFRFVFLDACHTAGSNKDGVPADKWRTLMTRDVNLESNRYLQWRDAFMGQGAFRANNGYMYLNVNNSFANLQRPPRARFYKWRKHFREGISDQNVSVTQAFTHATGQMPTFAKRPYPSSVDNILVLRKTIVQGDWEW